MLQWVVIYIMRVFKVADTGIEKKRWTEKEMKKHASENIANSRWKR